MSLGRVLVIAGSDSGGGAGIQGDIKTITALGGFASTSITALTAQNTKDVTSIHEIPAKFVSEQIRVVMADLGADCIKIGMLFSIGVIEAVSEAIKEYGTRIPVVADPVMIAKGGAKLLSVDAVKSFKKFILPQSTLLTPNIPEAEILAGQSIFDPNSAEEVGKELLKLGPRAVLMKGGHLKHDRIIDKLITTDGIYIFEGERINSRHTHGTGCTFASACATGIAQGMSIKEAVKRAQSYIFEAIRTAPGYGSGFGPLNHGHTVRK